MALREKVESRNALLADREMARYDAEQPLRNHLLGLQVEQQQFANQKLRRGEDEAADQARARKFYDALDLGIATQDPKILRGILGIAPEYFKNDLSDGDRQGFSAFMGLDDQNFMAAIPKAREVFARRAGVDLPKPIGKLSPGDVYLDSQGRQVASVPPEPPKPTERDKLIDHYLGRGFDQATATDLAAGKVQLSQPDQFGNYWLINTANGTRTLPCRAADDSAAAP